MRALSTLRVATLALAALCALGAAPPRGDPASRIPEGPNSSEYWDFVASFDSGERMFARFMITNEFPGDALGLAIGHLVRPDGTIMPFRNARLAGQWQLGPGGRWLKIGGSRLDLASSRELRIDIDKTKRGIQIHLKMRPESPASAGPELPDTSVDLLALAAPIEGTYWFTGMAAPVSVRGRAGITHTWTGPRESERMLRRLEFFGRDGELALYLGEALAPSGQRAQLVAVEVDGKRILNVTQVTISHGNEQNRELGDGYPVPAQLSFSGSGISGLIHLKKGLVQHDPLQDVPLPFRFLLSSAAHPQRVWMESRFEVRIDPGPSSKSLQAQGTGITSVTFTNPLPLDDSKTPRD
jgi:hypothetical protein